MNKDEQWAEAVKKNTTGGAVNFRNAAFDFAKAVAAHPICDACETVAHCEKNGCVPVQPLGDARRMVQAQVLRGLADKVDAELMHAAPAAGVDTCDLVGIRSDGSADSLGKIPMPPMMKARELCREQFGGDPDDDTTDAAMALYVCERLIQHMQATQAASAATAPAQPDAARQFVSSGTYVPTKAPTMVLDRVMGGGGGGAPFNPLDHEQTK